MRTWSEAVHPRHQIQLISPSLDERIGRHAGVRFLDGLLNQIDWSDWEQAYPGGGPGRPPHHPRLMCAAILYGLIRGMHSTRMLEYATEYNVDFQWLLDGRVIDPSTFAKFRTVHGERIKELFRTINRKAADLKKRSLEEIIIDGTRIRADSDRHGARTAEALQKRLDALDGKLAKALDALERAREEGEQEAMDQRTAEAAALKARKQRDERVVELMEYSGAPCGECPLASRCLSRNAKARTVTRDEHEGRREEVRERMSTEQAQQIYSHRAPCVEGAFGTIKAGMKIRRFQRRGLEKVRQDWTWVCLAFNLRKMMGWIEGEQPGKPEKILQRCAKRPVRVLRRLLSVRKTILIRAIAKPQPAM